MTTDNSRAYWVTAAGQGELRAAPLPGRESGEVLVRTLHSGISRGTEALVLGGRVPVSQYAAMRAPFQEGDFPFPVKYGYASVGMVADGPAALAGQSVFCLYPHQDRYVVPADAVVPLPDEAKQLLRIVGIKANCKTACIERIDIGPKGAVLTLRNNAFPNPMGLVGLIQKNHAFWKIRPDQKIVVKGEWDTAAERLKVAERITADLARVAGA